MHQHLLCPAMDIAPLSRTPGTHLRVSCESRIADASGWQSNEDTQGAILHRERYNLTALRENAIKPRRELR